MTKVHFIYPHQNRISAPDVIGVKVAERLRDHYEVVQYEWVDTRAIRPGTDDILLGHPHPIPWTIFNRSSKLTGWRRKIAFSPFAHGDLVSCSYLQDVITRSDLYLAITGTYWFDTLAQSAFAHWSPKIVPVDLAIDRRDFPFVKKAFNPPGKRKFVYIGNTGWSKNTRYLSLIARGAPEIAMSWVGTGTKPIHGLKVYGRLDFSTESARKIIAEHDFLITVGSSDANPTTILEAMAWGLVPLCTPQSGYENYPSIVNIPLKNLMEAIERVRWLQEVPETQLRDWQMHNLALLDSHFNWERLAQQVLDAINSSESPALLQTPMRRQLALRCATLVAPHSYLRPRNWRTTAYTLLSLLARAATIPRS